MRFDRRTVAALPFAQQKSKQKWRILPYATIIYLNNNKVNNQFFVLRDFTENFFISVGLISPSLTTLGMSFLILSGGRSLSVHPVHCRSLSPEKMRLGKSCATQPRQSTRSSRVNIGLCIIGRGFVVTCCRAPRCCPVRGRACVRLPVPPPSWSRPRAPDSPWRPH